jgi:hypothetical protein
MKSIESLVRSFFVLAGAVSLLSVDDAAAERRTRPSVARASLAEVCPPSSRRDIGSDFFYKNNKPIRASSALNAPVIGQNPVITLAGQKGRGPRIFRSAGTLFATNGTRLATLTPYPCRADHCTGRVVSSIQTGPLRRAAIRASGSPAGWIKVGGICVAIPDIGKCFGNGVNMGRPLCDRIVK